MSKDGILLFDLASLASRLTLAFSAFTLRPWAAPMLESGGLEVSQAKSPLKCRRHQHIHTVPRLFSDQHSTDGNSSAEVDRRVAIELLREESLRDPLQSDVGIAGDCECLWEGIERLPNNVEQLKGAARTN